MIRRRTLPFLAGLAVPQAASAVPERLEAADGVALSAEFTLTATARSRGTILLFHMAGSNRGEYAAIAPELARRGFATLAIDQRSGGDAFGQRNETAAAVGRDPGYRAALPDLEAALGWARARGGPDRVLVWGSSYSAALVFLLAAARPVSAVLAFSPGEYLRGASVRDAAARVSCPVFVTADADPTEEAAAAAILAAVPGSPKRQHRPQAGAHGSSILRADRNPRGAAAAWAAVGAFLDEVAPG